MTTPSMQKLPPDYDPRTLPAGGILWHFTDAGWVRQTVSGAMVQAAYKRGDITRKEMAMGWGRRIELRRLKTG